ncbi:MAG: hypothetical protein R3B70_41765 [Polyangiaceae bacterium]
MTVMITFLGDELFSRGDVDVLLKQQLQAMPGEICDLAEDYLLNNSVDDICEALVKKYMVSLPTVRDTDIWKHREGTRYHFEVSFDGDDRFFWVHGSPFQLSFPKATVDSKRKKLRFTLDTIDESAEHLQAALENQIKLVRGFLVTMRTPVNAHNQALAGRVRPPVETRVSRLQTSRAVYEQLPYKPREDGSDGRTG